MAAPNNGVVDVAPNAFVDPKVGAVEVVPKTDPVPVPNVDVLDVAPKVGPAVPKATKSNNYPYAILCFFWLSGNYVSSDLRFVGVDVPNVSEGVLEGKAGVFENPKLIVKLKLYDLELNCNKIWNTMMQYSRSQTSRTIYITRVLYLRNKL